MLSAVQGGIQELVFNKEIFSCFLHGVFSPSFCLFLCSLNVTVYFLKYRMKENRQGKFSELHFTVLGYFVASVVVYFKTKVYLYLQVS